MSYVDLDSAAFTARRIANQVALLELAAEGAIADGDNEHAQKFRDAAGAIVGQLDTLHVELARLTKQWCEETPSAKPVRAVA